MGTKIVKFGYKLRSESLRGALEIYDIEKIVDKKVLFSAPTQALKQFKKDKEADVINRRCTKPQILKITIEVIDQE